ncbi:sulfurtransferase [Acrocarpospora corrugata]|uniref:Sulfurtransferase n=1 Tax=Acrocarpospora corrugata TaxID=35763 RepID=A0A5M3W3A2_9ACTN|nr:rhodanese-like domain-containing protein [Acrocarpospora corrugata]GES01088.1 sulfurtransferase [Acrocarpospora corrugata]
MSRNSTAVTHFAGRLAFETDPSDVADDLGNVVLIDTRSRQSWDAGHAAGARHLPTREIAGRARQEIDPAANVVVYCWGPGCNGATKAALEFARLGYRVKEMIGGFEYWAREGFPIERADGTVERLPADPLAAPPGVACAC